MKGNTQQPRASTPAERLAVAIAACVEPIELAHLYDHLDEHAVRMSDPSSYPTADEVRAKFASLSPAQQQAALDDHDHCPW